MARGSQELGQLMPKLNAPKSKSDIGAIGLLHNIGQLLTLQLHAFLHSFTGASIISEMKLKSSTGPATCRRTAHVFSTAVGAFSAKATDCVDAVAMLDKIQPTSLQTREIHTVMLTTIHLQVQCQGLKLRGRYMYYKSSGCFDVD